MFDRNCEAVRNGLAIYSSFLRVVLGQSELKHSAPL